jgi:hypothetical protein
MLRRKSYELTRVRDKTEYATDQNDSNCPVRSLGPEDLLADIAHANRDKIHPRLFRSRGSSSGTIGGDGVIVERCLASAFAKPTARRVARPRGAESQARIRPSQFDILYKQIGSILATQTIKRAVPHKTGSTGRNTPRQESEKRKES